jgi:GT2 family glycosyltransferase
MSPSPAFSIVIPTHNRAELLLRAVDSALASAVDEGIEVLVVDDASTDHTIERLQQRYGGDARVGWLRLQRNRGPSVARNLGLQHAHGEFVLFLDSDDVLLPQACALALAAFRRVPQLRFLTLEGDASSVKGGAPERSIVREGCPGWKLEGCDAVHWQRQPFGLRGDAEGPPGTLQWGDLLPAIVFGDLFYLSGLFIRRAAALAAGPFNPRFRYYEDWDFAARLCADGVGGHLDRVGFHRETGRADQLSNVRSLWRNAVMHQHVLATLRTSGRLRAARLQALSRRAQAAADYRLGCCLLDRHHRRAARGRFGAAITHRYRVGKSLVWLVCSSLPQGHALRASVASLRAQPVH